MDHEVVLERVAEPGEILRVIDGTLDALDGDRGHLRDPFRQRDGFCFEPIAGDHPIHQTEPQCLGRPDLVAGPQELLRAAGAEVRDLDERLHTGAGHPQHRVLEHGVVGRDDQVAHARDHQAAGDALALDHRDRRLGQIADREGLLEIHRPLVLELPLRRLAHLMPLVRRRFADVRLQVVSGGEVRSGTGDDDHVDVGIAVGGVQRVVEFVEELRVLRVADLGPVHRDELDRAAPLDQDRLVAHRAES